MQQFHSGTHEHLQNNAHREHELQHGCSDPRAQGPVWEGHRDTREWGSLRKVRGRPVCPDTNECRDKMWGGKRTRRPIMLPCAVFIENLYAMLPGHELWGTMALSHSVPSPTAMPFAL